VDSIELAIPRLREGSYFPSFIQPRRRVEKALLAVVQQAYIEGVSTRKVEICCKAWGCTRCLE
jgi:putative transposase